MTMRHLLAMAALLGGLSSVCCLRPRQLSPLSEELMLEEGSLVPANPSSQGDQRYGQRPLVPDLDDPIGDILEEIARLKGENKWLTEMMQSNARNIQDNADNLGFVDSKVTSNLGQIVLTNRKIDKNTEDIKQNTEDIEENEDIIAKLHIAPIGTISAWVTKPNRETRESGMVSLPEGWVRCNGDTIPEPSVWAGQLTPNLNGEKRFLRGASDSEVLTMEEDQMQDHKHQVSDPGHTHNYVDKWTGVGEDNHWGSGSEWDHITDRWDQPHGSATVSKHTGLTVQGVSTGKHGSETRPKNMHVIYIMRVW